MPNNENEISPPTPPKETLKITGPGACLRKIREARHLTLEEMTNRTRLSRERLIQLESDNYTLMGAAAFAKGYLRTYANQLGLALKEITDLLQTFDEMDLGANIQHSKPELIHEKMDQVSPKTTRWISYLIIIALFLGVGGYVWHSYTNTLNTAPNTDKSATDAMTDTLPSLSADSTTIPPKQGTPTQTPTLTMPVLLPSEKTNTPTVSEDKANPLNKPTPKTGSSSSPSKAKPSDDTEEDE